MVKIISTGSYLPEKIVTNNDSLFSHLDTSDEWIYTRTGIKQRCFISEEQNTSDIAYNAAINCLNKIDNFDINSIDGIIVATTTADMVFPATAVKVQNMLGITNNCLAFDIQAVCTGWIYALSVAISILKSSELSNILVIGADAMSKILDFNDRNTCILFGDGAGATLISKTKEDDISGFIDTIIHSNGQYYNDLKSDPTVDMDGRTIFQLAVKNLTEVTSHILKKHNFTTSDIKYMIPHQANIRIIQTLCKYLNLPEEHAIAMLETCGNTSAASIPIALDYATSNNMLSKGDLIVLNAVGGGLTWGASLLRW